ncbi:MAG: DUF368 domain-containing protein [Cellvibrio sp.]|jgi:putative membrane protein
MQEQRSIKDYLLVFLKGICMGAADVVPGVSGGTIAFITGVYDEWLNSLKRCTPAVLLMLKREGLAKTWKHINGTFLVCLFGGILVSLKTLAALVLAGLEAFPILIWAFCSGLLMASVYPLAREQSGWGWPQWIGLLAGGVVVYLIANITPATLPAYWWVLFLGGFVAICAMVLPGLSGSFILLLVGLYPVFLTAIHELDIPKLLAFGVGCICGLVLFSKFLSWLLAHYHRETMPVLIGLLAGSVYVTWPWKKAVVTAYDSAGNEVVLQQANLTPGDFLLQTGQDPMLLGAILAVVAGMVLVLGTEWIAMRMRKRPDL